MIGRWVARGYLLGSGLCLSAALALYAASIPGIRLPACLGKWILCLACLPVYVLYELGVLPNGFLLTTEGGSSLCDFPFVFLTPPGVALVYVLPGLVLLALYLRQRKRLPPPPPPTSSAPPARP